MGLEKNTYGGKGDSVSFKIRVLKLLAAIGTSGGGSATEATLLQVLTALQNIDISVDNIEIDADQINLNTDTLEALIAASNALLTTIDTSLNNIESDSAAILSGITGVGGTNFFLASLDGNTVSILTEVTAIDAGINGVGGVIDKLSTANISLSVLDDWDESDRAKVNLIVGQVGVAGGTGVDAANVIRVSLATDVPLPAFASGTETPTASIATDSTGSPVTAGKKAVIFTTDATFAGTILGVARNPNTSYPFEVTNPGATLAAIAYTVTAGSMTIDVQV